MPKKEQTKEEIKELSLYEKLTRCKVEWMRRKVPKSGVNQHLRFEYYTLADIVPHVIELFCKYSIYEKITFSENLATLYLTDGVDEETYTIPIPPLHNYLNDIDYKLITQAYGSVVTYYRRYLYMLALNITEPDAIDGALNTECVKGINYFDGEKVIKENKQATTETKESPKDKVINLVKEAIANGIERSKFDSVRTTLKQNNLTDKEYEELYIFVKRVIDDEQSRK